MLLTGCERPVMAEQDDRAGDDGGNVTLVMETDADGATRAPVGDVCSRLNVAVFTSEGTKVKTIAQSSTDAAYGIVRLSLAAGEYEIVAVAHNCAGSATITNAEKVTFPSNKVTDTFVYYGSLSVTGEAQEEGIVLTRCVAMLRLILDDAGSEDIASLKFYYLGGSSTLSPLAGVGCVNSKQTEYRPWNEQGIYELYTIPHSASDVITKLTITAYDAGDNIIGEWTLTDLAVTMNRISEYAGDLFSGSGGSASGSFSSTLTVNPEWAGTDYYSF